MSLTVPTSARQLVLSGDNDGAPSRSDSVIDFYTTIPALSREPSPRPSNTNATPGGRTIPQPVRTKQQPRQLERPEQSRAGSDYHDYSWDENMPQQHVLPRFTRPISSEFGLYQSTSFRHSTISKSDSLSRIPLYKDQTQRLNGVSSAQKRKPPVIATAHEPPEDDHQHNIKPQQMPRSVSMPLSNQSLTTSTDTQVEYGSLPARTRSQVKNGSIRRSASQSVSPRLLEVRDPKQLREDQARRLHAINNVPTGRPPWMNSFQPDPRLPADQQMLPTVARKLALERWVAEGGSEATFDIMWNQAPIENDMRPKSMLFETGRTRAVDSDPPASSAIVVAPEEVPSDDRRDVDIGIPKSSSTDCLGQSPAHQLTVPASATNFSRRSILKTTSQGSIYGIHKDGADSTLKALEITHKSDSAYTAPSDSVRPMTSGAREHDKPALATGPSTGKGQAKQKQTRPVSTFDHGEEEEEAAAARAKKSGCCLVM